MTIDECKEKISFSTKLFLGLGGIIVLIVGGLVNLHLDGRVIEIFWIGVFTVLLFIYLNFLIFLHIEKYIKYLGKL